MCIYMYVCVCVCVCVCYHLTFILLYSRYHTSLHSPLFSSLSINSLSLSTLHFIPSLSLFYIISSFFYSPLLLFILISLPSSPLSFTTPGKTLMSITIMWTLLNQGKIKGQPAVKKVVVACPTSLVGKMEIIQKSLLERFINSCLEWYTGSRLS